VLPHAIQEAFSTEGEARNVIRYMQRRAKRKKNNYYPVKPYKCRCGSVHLASAPRP